MIASKGLYNLDTADALSACIATINDAPDPLHYEFTPSVLLLSEMGLPALPEVLSLLNVNDDNTRHHAHKVFELVTFQEVSNRSGPGHCQTPPEQHGPLSGTALAPYNWNLPEPERQRAMIL